MMTKHKILKNVIVLMTHANPDEGKSGFLTGVICGNRTKKKEQPIFYHVCTKNMQVMITTEILHVQPERNSEHGRKAIVSGYRKSCTATINRPCCLSCGRPSFRDPFNYTFDPLVMTSLDAVGAAMINP